MTTYAAGLRVSEVVRLQVTDSESDRMLIRVTQAKGNKDRYTLLSTRLLTELRAYWKLLRPPRWLFPGRCLTEPMPSDSARKIYDSTRRRAQIQHGSGLHALRNASTYCYTSLIGIDFERLVIRARSTSRLA